MKHDWILDLLTDLRSLAKDNELLTLAAQLEDTQLVAAIEIAILAEKGAIWVYNGGCMRLT